MIILSLYFPFIYSDEGVIIRCSLNVKSNTFLQKLHFLCLKGFDKYSKITDYVGFANLFKKSTGILKNLH